jgi:hypothetical protein
MRDKVGDSLDEVEPIIEQAEKAGGPPKAPRGPRP